MTIPDAQAAVDKERETTCQNGKRRKSKVRKEVIEQAQKEGKTGHFATLIDLCHLAKLGTRTEVPRNTKALSH